MDEIKLSLDVDGAEPTAPVFTVPDDVGVESGAVTSAETAVAPVSSAATNVTFTSVESGAALLPDTSAFTEAELKVIDDFAKKIDVTNSAQVLQFGSTAQKKISTFSEAALSNMKTKDMNEIGEMVTGLVVQLKNFDIEDSGKKPGLFRKAKDKVALTKAKYDTVEKNVDVICSALEKHKVVLLKDVHMLDQMYEKNLEYYKELSMYVVAGRQKLRDVIEVELPALQKKAIESGLQEDAQAANSLADMCNRFDKKIHDLELTKTVSMQMSPQIRLVQSTNNIMIEKIHSSIVNTIPLWKNQMVLALGMAHSQAAIKAQREVTDMTNELLRKNADALKQNTIEAAKESERSIVDIETLKHTNQSLISTLDEVLQIQQTGRQKRQEAQVELHKIEDELKAKLLDIRNIENPDVVETNIVDSELKLK
ncbi:MAG: toxic anion resistance protein [Oscillospiraceae bacterium]|nr:toxic anion resistance protein [Oscillospiraceae bacterium]